MQKDTNSNKIIQFENVSKVFKDDEGGDSLIDISFSIEKNAFVSFVGSSGCGKSTVMELLAHVTERTSGTITRPYKTIMVFQKDSLLPWLTVLDNLTLVLLNEDIPEEEKIQVAQEKLALLQIDNLANKYPRELSGGQIQRVSIARALVIDPKVLILDEPFAALDEKTKIELHKDLLTTWRRHELTIIMISHQIEEVVLLSQKVFLMRDKKIVHEYNIPFEYPRHIEDESVAKKISEIRNGL